MHDIGYATPMKGSFAPPRGQDPKAENYLSRAMTGKFQPAKKPPGGVFKTKAGHPLHF